MFLKVVFNINIFDSFIYKKPDIFKDISLLYKRVLVPFRKKLKLGFVIEEIENLENFNFKIEDVVDVIDNKAVINRNETIFYKWLSDYYIVPFGQIVFNALPSFSLDLYSVEIIEQNEKILNSLTKEEKDLLTQIAENSSLKKLQRDFKFFFNLLNNLANKKIIKLKKKQPKSRKVKFLKLEENNNEILNNIFKSNKILPLDTVKKELKNYKKFLKTNSLKLIEKNKEFLPEFFNSAFKYFRPDKLNEEQQNIWNKIKVSLYQGKFSSHLIFGITGSGKTEIYLKAIEETLKTNRSVIYLVPEISLTPNIAYILLSNFSDYNIAVFHSKISKNLKYELLEKTASGEIQIVVGARSALFAPLKNLGLIIVDEEHEQSYKQEDKPRYNARDCAVMKAKINNAVVILGSATPSIQSYYNAKTGKYTFHKLTKRINNQPLPEFFIIDLKNYSGEHIITPPLKNEIIKAVAKKEQVILLINKKGYASFLICKDCGYIFKCRNCELSLTYYKSSNQLICSYCDNRYSIPKACPICKSVAFKYMGKGTEKIVEQVMAELGENLRIARFDGESTSKHKESIKILTAFNNREIDIIVGTQMIAKGYDFQNVSLVGIITVDNMLNFPDYNSVEKTFQLIVQCSGRAGRKNLQGKVLLQTFTPENYIFQFCKDYRFEDFYEYELEQRRIAHYPPFWSLAHIIFESNNYENTRKYSEIAKDFLLNFSKNLTILGPVESPIKKIRNKFRFSILLKGKVKSEIRSTCFALLKHFNKIKSIDIKIDIDPINLN